MVNWKISFFFIKKVKVNSSPRNASTIKQLVIFKSYEYINISFSIVIKIYSKEAFIISKFFLVKIFSLLFK